MVVPRRGRCAGYVWNLTVTEPDPDHYARLEGFQKMLFWLAIGITLAILASAR